MDMDIIKDMNSKSSQFKQGFMFGLGYLTAFGISISMIMLGGWVKACTDDIKELKQQKVDECKYEDVETHGVLLLSDEDEQRQEVQAHMDSKECCDECDCEECYCYKMSYCHHCGANCYYCRE